MLRLILTNLLLFILFILLFILSAFVIAGAVSEKSHSLLTAEVYIVFVLIHIYINLRLLKKTNRNSAAYKAISTLIIAGVYLGYLFIYR